MDEVVGTGDAVVSVAPVWVPGGGAEDRPVRVSAPQGGTDLPVLVFAHGYGSSIRAYGRLVDFWAAHGFVVVQPTFVDSRSAHPEDHEGERASWWRSRVEDVTRVLDHLDDVAAAVPGLAGRVDASRIVVAGHSFGGQTAGVLLGLRVGGADGSAGEDLADSRVTAGVLLATAGEGGEALRPGVAEQLPWLAAPDFAGMTTPSLVIYGDADVNPLTTRGASWGAEPYHLGPGARGLLTLFGAEHSLGGIPGYDAAETTDADPRRVAAVQTLSWAFLRRALDPGDTAWEKATAAFAREGADLGRLDLA